MFIKFSIIAGSAKCIAPPKKRLYGINLFFRNTLVGPCTIQPQIPFHQLLVCASVRQASWAACMIKAKVFLAAGRPSSGKSMIRHVLYVYRTLVPGTPEIAIFFRRSFLRKDRNTATLVARYQLDPEIRAWGNQRIFHTFGYVPGGNLRRKWTFDLPWAGCSGTYP